VDAAEVLEAAEGVLDEVSAAITFLIVADGALAAAPAGDDGNGASVAERAPQPVGIVALSPSTSLLPECAKTWMPGKAGHDESLEQPLRCGYPSS
jgi:hypothetical protein